MGDPLDARALLSLVVATAPSVHGSSPLPRPTDAAAALAHAIHTALGFRLAPSTPTQNAPSGAGPSGTAGADSSASSGAHDAESGPSTTEGDDDDARSETTTAVDPDETEAQGVVAPPENVLAQNWNSRGEDSYMFEYRHEQSAMTFRVRVGRMGQRIQVDATAEVSSQMAKGKGEKTRRADGMCRRKMQLGGERRAETGMPALITIIEYMLTPRTELLTQSPFSSTTSLIHRRSRFLRDRLRMRKGTLKPALSASARLTRTYRPGHCNSAAR